VAFAVEGELKGAMSCNCSICQRKGALMWFVPRDALTLATDEADLATYTFNKHVIHHRFCRHCGIHTFRRGHRPEERAEDGGGQHPLPGGRRPRGGAGAALRRALALRRGGAQ
jgi:hypothetical protein